MKTTGKHYPNSFVFIVAQQEAERQGMESVDWEYTASYRVTALSLFSLSLSLSLSLSFSF